MNIVMFTNTYRPHVGGVANSVAWLAENLRGAGHRVLVVAPEFPGCATNEPGVVRIPAMQNFRGSDFSVPIPLTRPLRDTLADFAPDIVHSHHPFLLGDTALRVSASFDLPIVYGCHTRYELYGHYVAQDAPMLQRLVLNLALGYCDLCDVVVAPSQSMAGFLVDHGVTAPVKTIPTGIDITAFSAGDGNRIRADLGIPADAFVVGHVGRLAMEKNLNYLADSVERFLAVEKRAHFLVVGDGPMREQMKRSFAAHGLADRVHLPGAFGGDHLTDMYAAIDAFAFSSHSETQGLVLAEAMAAGVPVIALDAFGTREMVRSRLNGWLLHADAPPNQFAEAIQWTHDLDVDAKRRLRSAARRTAALFSRERATASMLDLYHAQTLVQHDARSVKDSVWQTAKRRIEQERKILSNVAHAIGEAVMAEPEMETVVARNRQTGE
ncbi:glycosyl transferase group 1 [Pusillimonas sp. T7-7]|uniref:glycosyltransferase n=1 Tax=Pusillimonas sp. (strain T7-7) TaxID=1007105 RepID=UPI000208483A|nr:glycosyltransferase [Pusillimonas sp. T7-7]AEC18729.1 glycosyl transferase group 1 [Pusillimonas sp. T7-7]